MKKILLSFSLMLVVINYGHSQLGINTDVPLAPVHIDAKQDNGTSSSPTNITDDVVISSAGYVGIGKTAPTVALDVVGTIRLVDGTQAADRILVSSDTSGNAKWIDRPTSLLEIGQINDASGALTADAAAVDLTTTALSLSSGKWLIVSKFVVKRVSGSTVPSQNIWIYLRNMTTSAYESIVGATTEQSGSYVGTPQLVAIVDVPTGSTYEYRIYGSTSNSGMGTTTDFQGSVFYAVRLDEDTL